MKFVPVFAVNFRAFISWAEELKPEKLDRSRGAFEADGFTYVFIRSYENLRGLRYKKALFLHDWAEFRSPTDIENIKKEVEWRLASEKSLSK